MEKLLLVSGPRGRDALTGLLRELGFPPPDIAANSGEARRKLTDGGYSVVLINCPLPDEFGRELAVQAADVGMDAILLCPGSQADKLAAGLEKYGVFVLAKPLSRQQTAFALRLIRTGRQRLQKLTAQNRRLTKRLDEARIISQAKCALALCRGLSEEQAHRLIEKEAMDGRISSREAALEIMRRLEDEGLL